MKNWTKWYKQTLDNSREKNKKEILDKDGLTEREKATLELLMKQYGITEKALEKTQKNLQENRENNFERTRENEVERTLEKSKVRENVNRNGLNRDGAENAMREEIDEKRNRRKEKLEREGESEGDKLTKALKSKINEIEEETAKKVQALDEKYEKTGEEKYKYVKNRIDYLLNYNDTGSGDIFYDIKENLLSLIEDNKEHLSQKKYDELIEYVNSKTFIDNGSYSKTITLYVNDKKLTMTSREFDFSTKITYKSKNFIGMVYGELISVNYDGDDYKVKVGGIAPTEDVNVVKAIAKRKKVNVEIGTCITYNNKIYTYSGDGVWRFIVERGGSNFNDGLGALMKKYENDLYNSDEKDEEE